MPDYDTLRLQEMASISDLAHGLTDEEWNHASLFAGWRVRDVISHMCLGYTTPMPSMVAKIGRAGFNVDKASLQGSIDYGTTHSPIPDQPWGVATLKPGKLYLHLFASPSDGTVFVPSFTARAKKVFLLDHGSKLKFDQTGLSIRYIQKSPHPLERHHSTRQNTAVHPQILCCA